MKKHVGLYIALITFLVIAVFPIHAYGFYVLLKFVVCGGCAFLAVKADVEGRKCMVWFLCVLAVLYNPVIRFPLGRVIWTIVNIVTIIGLIVDMKGAKK